ncbi:hypothetical protein AYJ54_35650 [Bradyrhizobium centrolobii]|uniref:Uncharacterized protein n=2 Tax=Bradyrhizobium centrolobii TaxID=1505087 RepID=A0A176Y678_9BRAD|nr:hypothetical protein AYJ54_35650 [Bradyrhizobium centrolobii]
MCTCLWGGLFNPIIPVFDRPPPEWKSPYERSKGSAIAKGYVKFFEPDVYVEATAGLLEKAGLFALRQEHGLHTQVITLAELFKPEGGQTYSEPAFGLNIHDVLTHIYRTEQKFVLREKQESILVKPQRGNALAEAVFGVFPTATDLNYIQAAYADVLKPTVIEATPDAWRRTFLNGAAVPLRVTGHGVETTRYWHHDLVLFVFDAARATDLIDLWNLRIEPHPVIPVPVEWFEVLAADICELLKSEHRPVIGNPNGVMHNATIEFGRSIEKSDAEALINKLPSGLPEGALIVKHWRNSVWTEQRDDLVLRDGRMKVAAKKRQVTLAVTDDGSKLRTTFEVVQPEFASQFARSDCRWVNTLRVSTFGQDRIAQVLPFNTFDRKWPSLGLGGEQIAVGGEGWVYPQRYTDASQFVSLLTSEQAVIGSLDRLGIRATLSEPGHIAKQMLEHLGGLHGIGLLADLDTLKLLNKMAGGLRRKRNADETIEENFGLRTATLKDWMDLAARRREPWARRQSVLAQFTERNVIRLGLETDCPHCRATNWNTLSTIDYQVMCERCLKPYEFPQADLREQNRNWTYRVVGPFSVPDFGRGSYSALLALRTLSRHRTSSDRMTYSTAMNLGFDGVEREVDFLAWYGDERMHDTHRPPQLVLGEAKSLGKGELITASELAKLKMVASKLPDAVIVLAVLRDHFTSAEKAVLRSFVNWGRRVNDYGQPTNPVLLLTAHELMMDLSVGYTWKKLGGIHAKFEAFEHTRTLSSFADATQQIYLGMPSFQEVRRAYWNKRPARRAAGKRAGTGAALPINTDGNQAV